MRILLVEDEAALGDAIAHRLRRDGHAVDWATTLADASAAAAAVEYGVVLLDLHLPDGSGLDLLSDLRGRGDPRPVVILTARDQIGDRILGLDRGADDYLVKPFDLEELIARIRAVVRRGGESRGPELVRGSLRMEFASRRVWVAGRSVDLTGREWAILASLAERPDTIRTKSDLETVLYAFGAEVESNAIEVYVSRLRKKLGPAAVVTIRGIGYRLGSGP